MNKLSWRKQARGWTSFIWIDTYGMYFREDGAYILHFNLAKLLSGKSSKQNRHGYSINGGIPEKKAYHQF